MEEKKAGKGALLDEHAAKAALEAGRVRFEAAKAAVASAEAQVEARKAKLANARSRRAGRREVAAEAATSRPRRRRGRAGDGQGGAKDGKDRVRHRGHPARPVCEAGAGPHAPRRRRPRRRPSPRQRARARPRRRLSTWSRRTCIYCSHTSRAAWPAWYVPSPAVASVGTIWRPASLATAWFQIGGFSKVLRTQAGLVHGVPPTSSAAAPVKAQTT